MTTKHRFTVSENLAKLPGPAGERFAEVFGHGTFLAEIYAPRGTDPQQPHIRDEAYVVVSGSGQFVNGDTREPFGPGNLLFVPAGVEHRFEEFTDDLVVYGRGGIPAGDRGRSGVRGRPRLAGVVAPAQWV